MSHPWEHATSHHWLMDGPRQNGRYFAADTFNRIFVNENVRISIKFSLKFVSNGPINNIPTLVQIMAWRHPGDRPLSEPVMVILLTHICVTRPQWVNGWADVASHAGDRDDLFWGRWWLTEMLSIWTNEDHTSNGVSELYNILGGSPSKWNEAHHVGSSPNIS